MRIASNSVAVLVSGLMLALFLLAPPAAQAKRDRPSHALHGEPEL